MVDFIGGRWCLRVKPRSIGRGPRPHLAVVSVMRADTTSSELWPQLPFAECLRPLRGGGRAALIDKMTLF